MRASRLAALVAAAPLLAGCVLERVLDTHRQLCHASPPQVVVAGAAGEPLRVLFERPTLTRDDVEWLVGLPPTRVLPAADGVRLVYEAVPAGPASDAEPLATELRFRVVDGAPRLAESIPPTRLTSLVPRELVDRTVATACKPSISLAPPGARFDLAGFDWTTFPDPQRIASILGPPHERGADGRLVYRFCLVPCDAAARPLAVFAYRFGADGRLEHGEFAYFRYRLVVDRPAGSAVLALRL